MRLFVALDISDEIRFRIHRFIDGIAQFAPDVRWMRPESLHVTLKFIGEQPEQAVKNIRASLSSVQGQPLQISFHGYGFFPGPARPRIFWIGIEAGAELASLAAMADEKMAGLGLQKDIHSFNPHLTLARSGSGAPHRQKKDTRPENTAKHRFQLLQQKLAALASPEFGTMTAREFFLYQSQTSAQGSVYTKLAAFGLG